MTARRRASRPVTLAVVAVLTAAVGLAALTAIATPAGAGSSSLPPHERKALNKLFKADLKPYGVRLTRGLLQNLETYEPDPRGTHLALYVEPIDDDFTNAQYVENFTALTSEFVPRVFKRWKGLESFDICQEPVADPRQAPPPVTQIFVTRDALDRVGKWKKATLTELVAASPRVRNVAAGYFVYFAPSLRSDPTLAAATRDAGWPDPEGFGGTTPSTTRGT